MRHEEPGALVFGGSRGIGAAIARRFAARGRRVGVVSRGGAEAQKLAIEIGGAAWCADVGDSAAVERVFEEFGPVEVVVDAAATQGGLGAVGPLWQTEPSAVEAVLRTNLLGAYHVLQGALRAMLVRGRGAVVLVSGGGAAGPRPRFGAYGMSKAALVRLVESTAAELSAGGHAIGVYALAPGAVHTAMTEEVLEFGERAGERELAAATEIIARGGVDPERAAELCAFLATPSALPLSGRLVHVSESWREYVDRDLDESAGRLRRHPFPPGRA